MNSSYFLVTLLLCLIFATSAALAAEKPSAQTSGQVPNSDGFSLGLVLGDPTGITLRSGRGYRRAIQAHLGFSPFPGDAMSLMVDWTYDVWDFLGGTSDLPLSLPLYLGAGVKAQWFNGQYQTYGYNKHYDDPKDANFGLGARGLVGLRASFHDAPFDLFLELAPLSILIIVPNLGIVYDFDAAIGARYRF